MKKNYYAIIMAGGIGSRFWPVSTEEKPKQFHDMTGSGMSLLKHTFLRLNKLIPEQNIFISTQIRYKDQISQELPGVPAKNILTEPVMRNTAPAILYNTLKIHSLNPDAQIIVAPSDHWIDREDVFIERLGSAFEYCREHDVLMTMGIVPDHPNTGYGYIRFEKTQGEVHRVKAFTEKPELEKAVRFVQSGEYLWNAGIFIWSAKAILNAFATHLPDMFNSLNRKPEIWNTSAEDEFIALTYPSLDNISVDYGIMEKADNVRVIPLDAGWNDLGTWGALYKHLQKDNNENAILNARVEALESSGNMIRTTKGKKLLIKGLNDYIIVEHGDYLMIIPRSDEQAIKQYSKLFDDKM